MRQLSLRVVIGLYLTVLAFGQGSKSAPAKITSDAESKVTAGSDVTVEIHLKNTSGRPLEISENVVNGVGLIYDLHITNQNGIVLPAKPPKNLPNFPAMIGSYRTWMLQPGEEESDSVCASCRYDGLAQEGKYEIYALRSLGGIVVESNTVTLNVVPKQSSAPE